MYDRENEFINRYRREKNIYLQWGNYVKLFIENFLRQNHLSLDEILKMSAEPRLKQEDSLVSKAFYRDKNYKNPYEDITDKVGIRFVVLTTEQIGEIKSIIESAEIWEYSQDVDYEKEIQEKPELFVYQSVHYIVRSNREFTYQNVAIPKGIPCEIQIRTLLQHAYAELSHDTIYKKNIEIPISVRRGLAKSMALIETADAIFKEVYDLLSSENKFYTQYKKCVSKFYDFKNATENLNNYIYMHYLEMINENKISVKNIEGYITEKRYLCDKITEKNDISIIYRQHIVFLLYYLISNYRTEFMDKWPLSDEVIWPLFVDLGISFEDW